MLSSNRATGKRCFPKVLAPVAMSLLLPFGGCGTDAADSGEKPEPIGAATGDGAPDGSASNGVSSSAVPSSPEGGAPNGIATTGAPTTTVATGPTASASGTATDSSGGSPVASLTPTADVPSPSPDASSSVGAEPTSTATGGQSSGGSTGAEGGARNEGGSATGGVVASGGTAGSATGGAATAGASAGGATGMAGAGSPGCGAANPLQSNTVTVDIDGTSRTYVLDVPADYDSNTQYRLVFVWHPLGGSASQVVNGGYNGLKSLADGTTIFVAPDGLDGSNAMVSGKGWWNAGDGDMKFLTAMLDEFNANLCIDQERIFSTGFSFGGMMSYTVGYEFDVFRAIAPCSGNLTVIPHEESVTGPLAIMAFHGDNDTFVTTAGGKDALDQYVSRNNCGTETQQVEPSPCVEYQGCDVPTIWCEFPGAHEPWSQQPQAIWNFFSQF